MPVVRHLFLTPTVKVGPGSLCGKTGKTEHLSAEIPKMIQSFSTVLTLQLPIGEATRDAKRILDTLETVPVFSGGLGSYTTIVALRSSRGYPAIRPLSH